MADVNRGNRPLSPHLTIYRPQLTSVSSIMVRITGIIALGAALIVVAWLLAAATSESAFDVMEDLLDSWMALWFFWVPPGHCFTTCWAAFVTCSGTLVTALRSLCPRNWQSACLLWPPS